MLALTFAEFTRKQRLIRICRTEFHKVYKVFPKSTTYKIARILRLVWDFLHRRQIDQPVGESRWLTTATEWGVGPVNSRHLVLLWLSSILIYIMISYCSLWLLHRHRLFKATTEVVSYHGNRKHEDVTETTAPSAGGGPAYCFPRGCEGAH